MKLDYLFISLREVAYEAGGRRPPPAWIIQGKLCFQGKLKLLKNS